MRASTILRRARDPEKAKALLAEAGHADGFATSLTMASSFPAMVAMAPIIQANLAAVGIKAEIKTMEIPRYWDEVWGPSKFDLTAMYWVSARSPIPTTSSPTTMPAAWRSTCRRAAARRWTRLLAKAKSATTQEARKAAYAEQQKLSLEEMPIVPLVNAWILTAYTDKLKNYKPMRTGFLKTLKDAWLEA